MQDESRTDTPAAGLPRARALALTVAFFASLLAVFVLDLLHGTYGELLERTRPTGDDLLDGDFARSVDRFLEADSWTMRATRPAWNGALLDLFAETPPYVFAGRDGWFFTVPEIAPLDPAQAAIAMRVMVEMSRVMRDLVQSVGGRFLIVVVPEKWRFAEDRVLAPPLGPRRRALYDDALMALRGAGLDPVDARAALRDELAERPVFVPWPPTDTHLSRDGYDVLVRRAVAPRLGTEVAVATERLASLPTAATRHHGNILGLMSLDADGRVGRTRSFPERAITAPTAADRAGSDVIVLGDSYATYYDELFPRLLQAATALTVDTRYLTELRRLALGNLRRGLTSDPPRYLVAIVTESRFGTIE